MKNKSNAKLATKMHVCKDAHLYLQINQEWFQFICEPEFIFFKACHGLKIMQFLVSSYHCN